MKTLAEIMPLLDKCNVEGTVYLTVGAETFPVDLMRLVESLYARLKASSAGLEEACRELDSLAVYLHMRRMTPKHWPVQKIAIGSIAGNLTQPFGEFL